MEIVIAHYQAMAKRAEEILQLAKEKGWSEDELRQAVELTEKMIRLSF